jgi:mono/diheme cytochrome c family protein
MNPRFRTGLVLAEVVLLGCTASFAQSSGEAIYKEKCVNCHGSNGLANSGISKMMKVKPITDPEVKKLTEPGMIQLTRDGVGKMQAYKGELTETQIKDSVDYFRTFLK